MITFGSNHKVKLVTHEESDLGKEKLTNAAFEYPNNHDTAMSKQEIYENNSGDRNFRFSISFPVIICLILCD